MGVIILIAFYLNFEEIINSLMDVQMYNNFYFKRLVLLIGGFYYGIKNLLLDCLSSFINMLLLLKERYFYRLRRVKSLLKSSKNLGNH